MVPMLAGQMFLKMSKQNIRYCIKHGIEIPKKNNKLNFQFTKYFLILVFLLSKINANGEENALKESKSSEQNISLISIKMFLNSRNNLSKQPHRFYHIMMLILSNDIQLNPGPTSVKICGICNNSLKNQLIKCQTCNQLYHFTCIAPDNINTSFEWVCPSSMCLPNHQSLPILNNIIVSPNRFRRNQNYEPDRHLPTQSLLSNLDPKEKENLDLLDELPKISSKEYMGKDLCRQCYKQVTDKQAAILCDICDAWSHTKCCNIATHTYNEFKRKRFFAWSCCKCRINEMQIKEKININRLPKNISPDAYEIVKQGKDETLILHINCRSLIKKREELDFLIQQLKPNIICLTETWFDGSVSPKDYAPEGYNIIRHDRSEMFKTKYGKNNGGGVAIIYKNHIKIQKISLLTDSIEEILWIRVKTKYSFLLGVVYRPVYSDMLREDGDECLFESNIRTASESAKNIILLGDFNINYLNQNDHLTEKLENICSTNGLTQHILKPTRIDPIFDRQTLIDHIWLNKENVPVKSAGTCLGLSDHLGTYVKINTRMENEEKIIVYRDYKEYSKENFCTALQTSIDGSDINISITVEKNVHEAMEKLSKLIINTLDQFAPLKERKIRTGFKSIPWYTAELRELLFQKNSLLKDFYQYGLSILKNPIKKINNKIVHLKRKLKSKYLTKKLTDEKNNPKEYWKTINSIIGSNNNTEIIEPDMMTQAKADDFNHFFANIGEDILKELNLTVPPTEIKGYEGFSFQHETEDSISKLVDSIKLDVATGRDGISSRIIKDSKTVIVPILTKIINLGYTTNTFPNSMKKAAIKPLHKKEDSNIISNYRPISILPCLSKIFERSAANQLVNYLEGQNLINSSQHAYRKNHGTKTCLFQVVEYVQKLLDEKKLVALISLDLSKAFDAINHQMLLAKLCNLGLSESALFWVSSYLSERKQCTKFSRYTSKDELVTAGVPQGSILGPLLFICFSNDLYDVLENKCKAFSYADDSQLIVQSKDEKDLKRKIEEIIQISHRWYSQNCMKANQGKTEILIVNTRNIRTDRMKIKVKEKGKTKMITPSKSIKVLGIMIDEKFNWKKQVLYVKKHATNTIRKLHRINHLLPVEIRIQLYLSLVVPHFDYCDVIWAGCTVESAKKLQVSQNFAVRSITGAKKHESATESFAKLKFLNLKQRRQIHEVVFAHKSLVHSNPNEINEMYLKQCPTSNTRSASSATLNYPSHKTRKYQTGPFYRTIQSWNSVPNHISPNTTTKAFKNEFQRHIIKTTYPQH